MALLAGVLIRSTRPAPFRLHRLRLHNSNHRNLYGSATVPGMGWLCIAGDHARASLHSWGPQKRCKSDMELVARYAKSPSVVTSYVKRSSQVRQAAPTAASADYAYGENVHFALSLLAR